MSVVIIGVSKPPFCLWAENGHIKTCKILNGYCNCSLQEEKIFTSWEDRYARCPLINLGSHGDLIDKEILKKDLSDFYSGIVTARQLIDAQDVVLEANEVSE